MSQPDEPPSQKPPESDPSGQDKQPQEQDSGKRFRLLLVYVAIAIIGAIFLNQFFGDSRRRASYDELLWHIEQDHVLWMQLGEDTHRGRLKVPEGTAIPERFAAQKKPTGVGRGRARSPVGGRLPYDSLDEKDLEYDFFVNSVRDQGALKELTALLEEKQIRYEFVPTSIWPTALFYLLPLLLILAFWYVLMRQSGQMGRAALSFGRSRAKLQGNLQKVTFADVAGCDEAKEELKEVVDFLRSPRKYQVLGGRMPKGILLVGPPGTGKTLLARAVAGESKAPFFTLSGSDFVEMFVGVGAARVRDLFQQAKGRAPCIVFVDELDAVGRHRGAGLGGGHDEREQTLNQLLVEMDGFDTAKGVIFLAATNRPDVLDPALLRPGRFDRQVVIDAPDARGREAIVAVHAKDKPFAEGIDFAAIAARTPGFTGADLANVVNESALLAARRAKKVIEQSDLDEAVERVIAGPERKSRRLGEEERRTVAYHEAGHALVAALTKHSDPVRKISIIPRGHAALGYTMQTPDGDRFLTTRSAFYDQLKSLLAGRAAEILIFDELSTGAANDLERATRIARAMVCRYGMSEAIGPVTYGREPQQIFLGRDFMQEDKSYSEKSSQEIDREVRKILDESNDAAVTILRGHRSCLVRIASTLLEEEVINEKELNALLESELGDDYKTNGSSESSAPAAEEAEVKSGVKSGVKSEVRP
ncbi:MAG: ATP-dependent zinc metalloprotease FtsH [Planctomycetota bacterium]|nr:ATP-dependent zinc metalloprotease FtsH [Planctomycetota bacterium]